MYLKKAARNIELKAEMKWRNDESNHIRNEAKAVLKKKEGAAA